MAAFPSRFPAGFQQTSQYAYIAGNIVYQQTTVERNEKARLNGTHFYVRAFDFGLCSLALEFNFPAQFSAVQMRQSFVGLCMTWLAPVLRATMLAKGLEEADSFFLFSVKVLCNFKAIKSTCR